LKEARPFLPKHRSMFNQIRKLRALIKILSMQ
jgi:hypothetical protein